MHDPSTASLSIIIPFLNEVGTLEALVAKIHSTLGDAALSYEIILVNDGSTDGGEVLARSIAEQDPNLVLVDFTRNFGKAAALTAGFKQARGQMVVTMDADLQDDPNEVLRLMDCLNEGYDVVSGWKRTRHDPASKRLPSKLFNYVVGKVFGLSLHDMNCGLKAYRADALKHLKIYGELHRFTPALLHANGFKVAELEVTHHPRTHGQSKYGSARLVKGMLDLLTVILLTRYRSRPLHLFGFLGLPIGGLGGLILLYLSTLWMLDMGPIGDRPLLMFGILLVLTGMQLLGIGLIAELIVAGRQQVEDTYIVDGIYGEDDALVKMPQEVMSTT